MKMNATTNVTQIGCGSMPSARPLRVPFRAPKNRPRRLAGSAPYSTRSADAAEANIGAPAVRTDAGRRAGYLHLPFWLQLRPLQQSLFFLQTSPLLPH